MTYNPFGLDIGSTSIKAVCLSKEKDFFLLNSALTYPTPPKGMLSESPLDQEEMVQAIRKIVGLGKISTKYVNIALAESQVYTKVVEMPVLSDKELSSAIYWEAEQHIPVPISNIILDWKVLNKPTNQNQNENKMDVLLVGAPTALVEKYQKILSMAGLVISSIETEILSTIRALTYVNLPEGQIGENKFPPSVIIHIGAISSSMAIVKDGIIVFTYAIPIGGNAISRAIASDFGFSLSQAEEYKKVYGISEKVLGGKISKLTEPILMSIFGEVKKALAFYADKYKEETQVRQIILSGGTARLPGIDLFFAKNCGIETMTANPWKILGNKEIPGDMQQSAPDYTIAIGLAMRDYEQQ